MQEELQQQDVFDEDLQAGPMTVTRLEVWPISFGTCSCVHNQ